LSLGLPEFGSRGSADPGRAFWRAIRTLGFVALAYALALAIIEWRASHAADLALDRARVAAVEASRSADDTRRLLQKNADLLVAAASVESSPDHLLSDFNELLPPGVSLTGFKVDYLPDVTARIEFAVVARTPDAYDRFLRELSGSALFSEIKPGSESRPGMVKATVSATHRPHGGAR